MTTHDIDIDIDLPPLPEWMNNYTIPSDGFEHDQDVMLSDRMHDYARAAVEADRKRRNSTQTLGKPECNHCGGTGDVSGEYPGIACPVCAGTGKAPQPAEPVKRLYAQGTALGEFGVIPMCDQVDE